VAEKWADYLISAVRYNSTETHIDSVRIHVDNGDSVGAGVHESRQTVVNRLGAGYTFMTITAGDDGKWNKGAKVQTITIDGVKYIKTVADRTTKDNLGALPRF
jgi:hypothetical protein